MADVRVQSADKKYAATKVVVLIPVKRGLFRRNGLLVLGQAGALSLPSGMQEEGASWQETGTQIATRSGLDRAPGSMKLTSVLSNANGNLLVCETDAISATEEQRLAARGAQVIAKTAIMASVATTEIVMAFFSRPRYGNGNNSVLLPIIALASTGTSDSSASCSSAAATSSFSGSSTNTCN